MNGGGDPAFAGNGGRTSHLFTAVCYRNMMIPPNGVWQGDELLKYSLPLLIVQIALTVVLTRVLVFLLRPLRQPRVISEILCGLLMGPTVLGTIHGYYKRTSMFGHTKRVRGPVFWITMFPDTSLAVLETLSHIGLLYYSFFVGLEIDLRIFKRTGRRAMILALTSIALPFLVAYGATATLGNFTTIPKKGQLKLMKEVHVTGQTLFLGISMAITGFPVVASILTDNKLINTEIGRVAMSSTIIIDVTVWMILAVAIPVSDATILYMDPTWKLNKAAPLYTFLCCLAFVLVSFFVVRPGIIRLVKRKPEGENFKQAHICLVLIAVVACSLLTELIGAHAIFGGLVLGLTIPNGALASTLLDSLEDFVSGLMVPLFYVISGLRTNLPALFRSNYNYKALISVVMGTFGAKVVAVFLLSMLYRMQPSDGISLGLLLNTKGLMQLIILNLARDLEVLDQKSFAIMVLSTLIMTGIISPLVNFIYKFVRGFTRNKYKTFEMLWKTSTELRIIACLHTPRQASGIISLMEISKPSRDTPVSIYALHLVELTGRASAMLIVNNASKSSRTQAQSEQINSAFKNYEQKHNYVYTETITTISPHTTMHEDICNLAEEKRSTFIILPFHKQQAVDGTMDVINSAYRNINQNVLVNAPCTVGILIDRGLGGSATDNKPQYVAMLFFGGSDDREALSFAQRLARNHNIRLNVLRFLSGENVEEPIREDESEQPLTVVTDKENEKQIDDEFVRIFRTRTESIETIKYNEMFINNVEEMTEAIRSMESNNGLFVVGRAQNIGSSLTVALAEWSECPELGVVGELLASTDFKTTMSVLIVQQYMGVAGTKINSGLSSQQSDNHLNHFSTSSSQVLQ